jgi:hypothetical protein
MVSVGQAYSAGAQRIGALLLALVWIVVRFILLIIAVAILAGIVSAIYLLGITVMPLTLPFAIVWSLIPQAIVLDGVGDVASSRRSRQLVTGYWWKTCALVVVTAVLVFIVGRIPTLVLDVIIGATTTSPAMHTILDGIIGLIAYILVLPIQFSAMTLLFYDLKIRKEAFDLEAMAQQAGAPTPTAPY